MLHYQHHLVTQGRKPTRAEYEAAQQWMATALEQKTEQEKVALARQACEWMSMAM